MNIPMDNTQSNTKPQILLKFTDDLIRDITEANKEFAQSMEKMLWDLNINLEAAEKEFERTERALKKFEEDAINTIDREILELASAE